jgi:uncharacterized membrane protein
MTEETPSGSHAASGEVAAPARNLMAVSVLSLVGLLISLYLLAHSLGLTGPVMCGIGDCEAVQTSPYSYIGPIPISGIGAVGYVALLVLAFLGLQPRFARSKAVSLMLLGGSFLGVAFSAYLTYLEASVIHAWCQWCVGSAVIITVIFILLLPEIRKLGEAP